MDSRASTSTFTSSSKPKPLIIMSNRTPMGSNTRKRSPSSPHATFRSSPLNPSSTPSSPVDESAYPQKRSSTFPASRPLRPFPSIAHSIDQAPSFVPVPSTHVREGGSISEFGREGTPMSATKRSPKIIEISSKWKGGFFILGMTQAEFSRRT